VFGIVVCAMVAAILVVDSAVLGVVVVVGTPEIIVDNPIPAIVVVGSKRFVVSVVAGHTPGIFDDEEEDSVFEGLKNGSKTLVVTLEALGVGFFAFPLERRVSSSVPFFVFLVIGSSGRRSGIFVGHVL